MISHAHQIDQSLAALEQAKSSLRGERIAFDENIEIGAMIEVPAAALAVGLFLRRLDFLSIGTNDLIQYTLAIDRSDEQVANLYDPLHPAVLMLLTHVISTAEKAGIPVFDVWRTGRRPAHDATSAWHGTTPVFDVPGTDSRGQTENPAKRHRRTCTDRSPHSQA